jgi:tight adherence protein C
MTLLFIAIAAALTASIVAGVLGRRAPAWWQRVTEGRRVAARAEELPPILRLLLTIAEPLAAWLGPRLPTGSRQSVQRRLRRAGIDEAILPQQWLALCGVSSIGGGAVVGGVGGSVGWALVGAIAGAGLPVLWMRDVIARRTQEVVRDLPVYVDMLTLSLEAGGALSVALKVATERAPDGVLRRAFLRVQGDLRAGRSRGEALQALAERLAVPAVDPLVAALVQAESSGASLASMLRAQADQRLHERFARAEKLALEAPVKMLGPLVLCIFPCTFLVLAFPLVMRVLGGS